MLKSLRSKLITFLSVIILFSIGITLFFNLKTASTIFENNTKDKTSRIEALAADTISNRTTRLILTGKLISEFPVLKAVVATNDSETIKDSALQYKSDLSLPIMEIYAPDGKPLFFDKSNIKYVNKNLINQNIKKSEQSNGRYFWTSYRNNLPAIMTLSPIGSEDNLFGWLATGYVLDEEFCKKIQAFGGLDFFILSKANIIGSNQDPKIQSLIKAHIKYDSAYPQAFTTTLGSYSLNADPVGHFLFVYVSNLDELKNQTLDYIKTSMFIGLFVLFLTIIIIFFLLNKVLSPLYKVKDSIAEIQSSKNFKQRVNVSGSTEFQSLAISFNQLMAELEKHHQKLLESSKLIGTSKMAALGEMAGGIAHEINNPLAIIAGYSNQISFYLKADKLDKEKMSKLDGKIQSTILRITKIVKGLQLFSRDSSSDEPKIVSVDELVKDTLSLCSEKFKSKDINLKYSTENNKLSVMARAVEISQVLLNLINNSADAISELNEKWIEIKVEERENKVIIKCIDCGERIPEEVIDKIFQPFYTTKEIGKGTGLGLSLSQGIMNNHAGSLSIDNDYANTCFVMSLPKELSGEINE